MPILHMIRETARLLASQGLKRPGILATDGTIQSGLYQKEFEAVGIQATVPTPPAQKLVMSLIYDDVKSGRDGDPQKFAAIHRDLEEQGCDCGVLACTELSVFADRHHLPPFYTDAMAVLASGRSRPAASPCGTSSSNSVKHRDFVSGPAGRLKIGLPGTNTISSLSTLKSRCSSWRTF